MKRVVQEEKPGFVYAAGAEKVEALTRDLKAAGVKAVFMHDGLTKTEQEVRSTCLHLRQVRCARDHAPFQHGR